MPHPLFKELDITPERAREILRQLETSRANQHSSVGSLHGTKVSASSQWNPELSLSFIQHYHKRVVLSSKSFSEMTSRDWTVIREAVSKRFPCFVDYSDKELLHHTRLLHSYAKVMSQVTLMPGIGFDEQFPGKYVFQKSTIDWVSLIQSKPRSQQRYLTEFSKRKDNRAIHEILEFQIQQKSKALKDKLALKCRLIGAKRTDFKVKVGREKRRTV